MAARNTSGRWGSIGLLAVAVLLFILLETAYAWIAGKPLDRGMIIGFTIAMIYLGCLVAAVSRKGYVGANAIPEPTQAILRETMDAEVSHRVRLQFGGSGPAAIYPRPMVLGLNLMISERVLKEFSTDALLWSAKTDAFASIRFFRVEFPLIFASIVAGLMGCALCERWKVPSVWYAIPIALVVALLIFLGVGSYPFQVQADRRFTNTEEDRRAAKEALSYPYFAQQDRPKSEKWMFSQWELRGRAKRLGIELERGFRASDANLQASGTGEPS